MTPPAIRAAVAGPALVAIGLGLSGVMFLNAGLVLTFALSWGLSLVSLPLIVAGTGDRPGRLGERAVIVLAVALAALIAALADTGWGNSSDEYGYAYLAATFLLGRATNPVPPLPGVFDFYWIATRDGHTASQYPPAWSVMLALFQAAGLRQWANPALVGLLGLLLRASLRQLGVPVALRGPLLALALLCPFTLFNGASLYNHLLAAVLTLAVCALQLRDDASPAFWKKTAIGTVLAILLATRHECVLLVGAAFAVDRLARRRAAALRDLPAYALGALPILALWLLYNRAVTGHPLLPPMMWAFPELQRPWIGGVRSWIINNARLALLLPMFAGVVAVPLYAWALRARLRAGGLRFHDVLFPLAVLFTLAYSADPGHQYGPRYWYFAWPTLALTVGPALAASGAGIPRLRAAVSRQLMVFVGFTIGFTLFLRLEIGAKRAILEIAPPQRPAIVLIPDLDLELTPWQLRPLRIPSMDLTRNGPTYDRPVLYGRADEDRFLASACALRGRHLYRFQPPAALRPLACPASTTP